jgi:hypothetical protein
MVTKEEFISQLQEDSGFDHDICEQVWQQILELDDATEFFQLYRTLTLDDLQTHFHVFAPFYRIVHTDKVAGGMGRGEVACVLALKDSRTGGTVDHDIIVGNKLYEVKELEDDMFRPAKYGNAFNFLFTARIQQFYRDIVPYAHLHDDVYPIIQPIEDQSVRVASGYEWPVKTSLAAWYKAFCELHAIRKEVEQEWVTVKSDRAVTAIRLPFKVLTLLEQFDDITKTLALDPDVFHWKIGNHPYVLNPDQFIDDLRDIRDGFFTKIDSLICFAKGGETLPLICSKEDFCIFALSQGQYRFRLKDKRASHKYEFLQNQ